MTLWFLSRSSHEAICRSLQLQIAELVAERDFYRAEFLKKVGVLFPVPVVPTKVTGEPVLLNQVIERKAFRLDKSDWTQDDRDWYRDEWMAPQVSAGMPADEADYWYFERFRDAKPLEAFSA
jgi:hypothetical protein